MRSIFLFIATVFTATSFVAAGEVLQELTNANFDAKTQDGAWLVKFYAPWCGHCKKLAPVFSELPKDSKIQEAGVNVARVDCTAEQNVCERFGVQSYPTIKLIEGDRHYAFSGKRQAEDLVDFAVQGYKAAPSNQVISAKELAARKKAAHEERAEAERNSQVVHIGSSTFDDLVKNSDQTWFLKFYAPWCGHCKRLAPTWDKLSAALKKSDVKVGKVDCTSNRSICSRFGVSSYPTLFLVHKGQMYKYEGSRGLKALEDFATGGFTQVESKGSIPDASFFSKIVDVGLEWAAEHTIMAVLAGILLVAVFVALLVALLDYCLGDDNIAAYQEAQKKQD